MDKLNPVVTVPAAEGQKLGQWLKSWQTGQVLQARVLDGSSQGKLLLSISGRTLTALADVAVAKGTLLRLEVASLYPVPSMKIVNAPLPGPVQSNPLQAQMQWLLPRQGSVADSLAALLDPAQRVNILSVLGVKNDVLERLEKSLSRFELLGDLKTLQKTILQSGFFLESELLRLTNTGGAIPQGDLKAILLRLLQRIKQAAGRESLPGGATAGQHMLLNLRSGVEGALATITLNQLAAIRPEEPQAYIWLFDMPFRIQDNLRGLVISVERDGSAAPESAEEREWKVFISLSLPRLGPIEAELFLRGMRISAVFYAQQESTVQLLRGGLPRLHAGMEDQGLEVAVLRCHAGLRGEDKITAHWRQSVDVQI